VDGFAIAMALTKIVVSANFRVSPAGDDVSHLIGHIRSSQASSSEPPPSDRINVVAAKIFCPICSLTVV
jgi:hypothetical protein